MTAAFALEPTGDPVPCSFPHCTLDAFHDGDHVFAPAAPRPVNQPVYTCRFCLTQFVIYGQHFAIERQTCGAQACIVALAQLEAGVAELPVMCTCAQRPYAHELAVHRAIKFESRTTRWPWSLRFAPEMEVA